MFVARPISAVGGLLVLVVLSRTLSATDYGFYFGLWALAEILILASNCGLLYAVYRYVSADEFVDGTVIPRGPVLSLLAWRAVTLCFAAMGAAVISGVLRSVAITPPFDVDVSLIFAAIVFGEGLARFVESIFDSMLSQSRSQTSLISRTLFRLIGLVLCLADGLLTLREVLYVEVSAAMGGALISLAFLGLIYWRAKGVRNAPAAGEYTVGFVRILKFSLPAFGAQLLGLVYGPDLLKIVLAKTAGIEAVAVFGFAYALAAVVLRYLPANLLAGIFRPVFVAASKKPDSDAILSDLLNMTIKINWLFVLPVFVFMVAGGQQLLPMIANGNYANSGMVLLILVGALLPITAHLTLSMYCLARENSVYPLLSSAVAVSGLPIGVILSAKYGANGMAVAVGVSEGIWALVCLYLLKRVSRLTVMVDWVGFAALAGASILAIMVGLSFEMSGMSWYFVAPTAVLCWLVGSYFLPVFSDKEKAWLISILPFKKVFAR